jgi:hypothetical protein
MSERDVGFFSGILGGYGPALIFLGLDGYPALIIIGVVMLVVSAWLFVVRRPSP